MIILFYPIIFYHKLGEIGFFRGNDKMSILFLEVPHLISVFHVCVGVEGHANTALFCEDISVLSCGCIFQLIIKNC